YLKFLNSTGEELSVSNNLRSNRTHLKFSLKTAMWQYNLYIGDYKSFWCLVDEIIFDFLNLEKADFSKTFQSTFTHVARALFLKINKLVHLEDIEERQKCILYASRLIKVAASCLSVDNPVKTKEFFMAAGVLDFAISIKKSHQHKIDVRFYFPAIFHVDSKYEFLYENLLKSYVFCEGS
ncbi:MAG: hypothetical protein K2W88_02070, partial [Pararheinheimera sp.]|nr:hypothetical protein [Rheinheimera sp.]